MSMKLTQLKLPLEILSLLLGIALATAALWSQARPSRSLVADVFSVDVSLAPTFLEGVKSLPAEVRKAFEADESVSKLLPLEKVRGDVAKKVEKIVDEKMFRYSAADLFYRGLLVVTVINEGEKPLKQIKLGLRYATSQPLTIYGADGSVRTIEAKGVVDLGDLPPRAQIKVVAWGLMLTATAAGDVTLSSQDGLGEIRLAKPLPEFIFQNEGVFFSFRHTTYFLIGLLVFALGAFGIYRSRQAGSISSIEKGQDAA